MGDVGDTWKTFDDATKAERKKREDFAREVIKWHSDTMDFEYKEIACYHFRLKHPDGRKLDFFPRSQKATWVGSNKFFFINDIEKFIETNFK